MPHLQNYPIVETTLYLLGLVAIAALAWFILRTSALRLVGLFSHVLPRFWDHTIVDGGVVRKLSWLVPTMILYEGLGWVPGLRPGFLMNTERCLAAMFVLNLAVVGTALLARVNEIYSRYGISKARPIKGYLQIASLACYLFGAVLAIATLLGKSPIYFLSGIGALTAVILLVFRDTLLSLVAGIQLTTNGLIRVGDWIEMPQFDADGDVIDIALHVVKVQNWDRTISVIPTHKFLEHSFKNWRGMQESGGRRIKRAIHIDIGSIRFLTADELTRLRDFSLLREYMERKSAEITEHNRGIVGDANSRRLTNVGTLRAYIIAYLKQHPNIHQEMTFLVRQLDPTAEGLPIEIYVFSKETAWATYEAIQADVFDHVLSILPEFGLRAFQYPSGYDIAAAAEALKE